MCYRSTWQSGKILSRGSKKAGNPQPQFCYLLMQHPMQSVLFLLLFLQPWHPGPQALTQSGASDEFAPIRQEWAQDLQAKKVDAAMALYAPDATFIDPDGSRAHGISPIRRLFEDAAQTFDATLTFHPQREETSGTLAVDSGTYTQRLVVRATGRQQESDGSYVMVYRREGQNWKILEQVWTATPPR
jgi:ketosteroid isomerase-like protein